jgi:hypothetical protein
MRLSRQGDDMAGAKAKRMVRESVQHTAAPPPVKAAPVPQPDPMPVPALPAPAVPTAAKPARASAAVSHDALAYGQQAWAAMAEAQAATVRGLEAMVGEMTAFTRSEMAAAADGAMALIGAKTFAEAVEVNLGFARRSFDALVGSSAKLSEIGAKTASDASRPILSRFGEGWKTPRIG